MMMLLYDECSSDHIHDWSQELILDTKLQGEFFALRRIQKQLENEANAAQFLNLDMSRALEYSKTQIPLSL